MAGDHMQSQASKSYKIEVAWIHISICWQSLTYQIPQPWRQQLNIPQELGHLLRLRYFFLNNNLLSGEFPINLTNCSELKTMHLGGNKLIGKIPSQIGSLVKHQALSMEKNNVSGKIPPFIRNISSLNIFSIDFNNLVRYIPKEMCFLKQLKIIAVHVNKLSGHIPTSIANASTLTTLGFGTNHFVGQVPNLGKLQSLRFLNLEDNNLGDNSTKDLEFLNSLTNCSKLQSLSLGYNNFGGSLQNSVGNLSITVDQLRLGGNQIYGQIPIELEI
ncbi:putative receptor-like protein kinase At3g47110 [Trifolium pratense]|uniref:putative receptor-like protein kinase At3g47110 n=1 Tax=Trifolium pratense TaxID=57577 RepID=UPI001E6932C1|nr:putative receptor-like protein kinase At3g47110 [Trifolium pratense]